MTAVALSHFLYIFIFYILDHIFVIYNFLLVGVSIFCKFSLGVENISESLNKKNNSIVPDGRTEPQIVQQKLYFRCSYVYNALVANDDLFCQLFPHADLPASDIFLHERYDPGSLRNDIALIRYVFKISLRYISYIETFS
jgi:hypothetical protein